MVAFNDGSTVVLKCLGDKVNPNYQWLNGLTGNRSLGLAADTSSNNKGTGWKLYRVEDTVYQLKCLGAPDSNSEFWLDAEFDKRTLRLASDQGNRTSGTYWRVQEVQPGIFTFEAMTSGSDTNKYWLDGNTINGTIGLAPRTDGGYTGTRWQLLRVPETGVSLNASEIELRTASGEARILTQDLADLTNLLVASELTQLRLGAATGVTLFSNPNFQGVAQPVLGPIPDLKATRLNSVPKSIKLWSSVGKPYTGKWAIQAPNGQYLSQASAQIGTAAKVGATETFFVQTLAPANGNRQRIKLMGQREAFSSDLEASKNQPLTLVEEDASRRKFSLLAGENRWISFGAVGKTISLRASNGQYVCAEAGGGREVVANRAAVGPWETFELVQLDANKVALKASNGQYVCAEAGGGREVVANRKTIGPWETFELVTLTGNQVALKASNGQYVCAEGGGGRQVVANRKAIGPWETFGLIRADAFSVSDRADDRAIFTRAMKLADNESQVGEVLPGEVALFEHTHYWGKAWIFWGDMAHFTDIAGLNDQVSSIVVGPQTGATLYLDELYGMNTSAEQRETSQEDVVEAVPSLLQSQVGNDAISSLRVWRNLPPSQVGVSFTCCLSQDYKLDSSNNLQEFSAYRTILQLPGAVTTVEVWATDLIEIEVDDTTYTIDEDRSVRLTPNQMQRLMITSTADALNTPGLKIRTNTMQPYERIVIFPDKYAHSRIAELNSDALWNAKDKDGKQLVDRSQFSREQVTAVQTSIQNTIATVEYVSNDSDSYAVNRTVTAKKIAKPWKLDFNKAVLKTAQKPGPSKIVTVSKSPQGKTTGSIPSGTTASAAEVSLIETVSTDDFEKLLATVDSQGGTLAQGLLGKVCKKIKSAVKSATSVVVGVVKDVINVVTTVVENAVEKVEKWVIDTAEKVGAFVEGMIEKIGVAIEKFIEYIRFLFNWDDILETQRYLATAVDTSLRYAVTLAEKAQAPVQKFFETQRANIREGIDHQIEKLAKDDQAISGKKDQPEALEWFLAKLTSGSKRSASKVAVEDTADSGNRLDQVFNRLLKDFESVATTFVTGITGLTESIAQFVTNPSKPQVLLVALLKLVRDLIDDVLTILQDLSAALLALVPEVIDLFRKLLKIDLNIPFVTSLFRLITKGEPLTLLNVACLLLAIPVTILSKLMRGRKPFQDTPQLALSDLSFGFDITIVVADWINGILTAFLDAIPEQSDPGVWVDIFEGISLIASVVSWGFGIPSMSLTQHQSNEEEWENIVWGYRTAVLGLDVIFSLWGALKPLVKSVIDPTAVRRPHRLERMKRIIPDTNLLNSALGVIDMGLTSKYVAVAKAGSLAEGAQVLPTIPAAMGWLRYPALTEAFPLMPLVIAALDASCIFWAVGIESAALEQEAH